MTDLTSLGNVTPEMEHALECCEKVMGQFREFVIDYGCRFGDKTEIVPNIDYAKEAYNYANENVYTDNSVSKLYSMGMFNAVKEVLENSETIYSLKLDIHFDKDNFDIETIYDTENYARNRGLVSYEVEPSFAIVDNDRHQMYEIDDFSKALKNSFKDKLLDLTKEHIEEYASVYIDQITPIEEIADLIENGEKRGFVDNTSLSNAVYDDEINDEVIKGINRQISSSLKELSFKDNPAMLYDLMNMSKDNFINKYNVTQLQIDATNVDIANDLSRFYYEYTDRLFEKDGNYIDLTSGMVLDEIDSKGLKETCKEYASDIKEMSQDIIEKADKDLSVLNIANDIVDIDIKYNVKELNKDIPIEAVIQNIDNPTIENNTVEIEGKKYNSVDMALINPPASTFGDIIDKVCEDNNLDPAKYKEAYEPKAEEVSKENISVNKSSEHKIPVPLNFVFKTHIPTIEEQLDNLDKAVRDNISQKYSIEDVIKEYNDIYLFEMAREFEDNSEKYSLCDTYDVNKFVNERLAYNEEVIDGFKQNISNIASVISEQLDTFCKKDDDTCCFKNVEDRAIKLAEEWLAENTANLMFRKEDYEKIMFESFGTALSDLINENEELKKLDISADFDSKYNSDTKTYEYKLIVRNAENNYITYDSTIDRPLADNLNECFNEAYSRLLSDKVGERYNVKDQIRPSDIERLLEGEGYVSHSELREFYNNGLTKSELKDFDTKMKEFMTDRNIELPKEKNEYER